MTSKPGAPPSLERCRVPDPALPAAAWFKLFGGLLLLVLSSPAAAAVPQRDVFYTYDMMGRQLTARFDSATGADGIVNKYNGFGDLTESTVTMGTFSRKLTSHYDGAGRRDQVTHPDGQAFTYAYDPQSRLTNLYEGAGTGVPLEAFTWNGNGTLGSRSEGTGTSGVTYSWDDVGRLTGQSDNFSTAASNVGWTFTFNPASQIGQETRNNDAYAYDGLVAVNRPYAVNGLNQYTTAGPASFTYDGNGNLTSDGSNSYTYDVENRLVKAVSGATTVNLIYDPLGRLFQVDKGTSGTTTRFVYDGDALVLEYDGSGAIANRYAHGSNAAADDPLVWYAGAGLTNKKWLHADHLGSIVAATDANGGSPSINAYDEYGIPSASNVGRFQYTGQVWIGELGMYYYKARIYSPTLGRFLQTDPTGYDDNINLYAYVADDPVNNADFMGLETSSFSNGTVLDFDVERGNRTLYELSGAKDVVDFYRHPSLRNALWAGLAIAPAGKLEKGAVGAWKLLIQGRAQVTRLFGEGSGHAFRSLREAIGMAKSGRYESVHLNRTLRSITGGDVEKSLRPDVAAVRPDGRVDIREVASAGQNPAALEQKYRNALGERAGTITVTKPTKEICTGSRIPGAGTC